MQEPQEQSFNFTLGQIEVMATVDFKSPTGIPGFADGAHLGTTWAGHAARVCVAWRNATESIMRGGRRGQGKGQGA